MLGPIAINGSRVGSPLERRLLAALLVGRGAAVSTDRLLDILWGDDLPPTATNSLQSKISRLRRLLGADALKRIGTGYTLRLAEGACDADRFDDLVRAADGLPAEQRLSVLDDAMGLWTGRAFDEYADEDFARPVAVGLEQRRLAASEKRLLCLLELERHQDVVEAAGALIDEDPFRESFWAAKIRALAGSDRSIEALRCYQDAHARFIDETGVAPSASLASIEQLILAGELDAPVPASDNAVSEAPTVVQQQAPTPVRDLPSRPLDTPLRDPPLIGRSLERAAIEAAMVEGFNGRPKVIKVVGEVGLGKTKLIEAAAGSVRADGIRTLGGRCVADTQLPLGPIGQVISALDISRMPSPAGERDFHDPRGGNGALAAGSAVLRLLDRLLEQPTLLVLDDLHWADEATASALELLVTEMASRAAIEPVRLVILIGHRSLEVGRSAHAPLERLGRHPTAETIQLAAFDESGVAAMIEAVTGIRPSGATAARIHDATAGTPLMVRTLLEHWSSCGELLLRAGCLDVGINAQPVGPVDVEQMWEQQWAAADRETASALELLSLCPLLDLLPKPAAVGVMSGVLGIDSIDALNLLDRAVDLGLLTGYSRLTFPPPIRRYIQNKVANAKRVSLLDRLGVELIGVPRLDHDATIAERFPSLAADTLYEAHEAGATVTTEELVTWARRAAEENLNLGAWVAAVHYLEITVAHSGFGASAPPLSDGSPLDLALGLASFRAHDEYRAQEVLRGTVERAESAGDPETAGAALSVLNRIAFAFEDASDLPVSPSEATKLMEGYIKRYADSYPQQAALGAAILAEEAAVRDLLDEARVHVARARSICDAADEPLALPEVGFAAGLTAMSALQLGVAEQEFRASSELALANADRWVASWGVGRRTMTRVLAGDDTGAQAALGQALDLQVPLRLWSELALTKALEASLAFAAGRHDLASKLLEESAALTVRSGYSTAVMFAAPIRALMLAREGKAAASREALVPLVNRSGRPPWGFAALLELANGNPDRAHDLVLPRLHRLPETPTLARLPMIVAAASTGAVTGDRTIIEATDPLIDWLHERGVRRVPSWPIPISELVGRTSPAE